MRFLRPPEFATWWQNFFGDDEPNLLDSAHPTSTPSTVSYDSTTPTSGFTHTTITRADGARVAIGGWHLDGAAFGTAPQRIGLILARQGAFSLGLVENARLISHHTGRRYVQGRTAAGGWSQQRYARRRKNQRADQVEVLTAKIPQVIVAPQALVWAGDRQMYSEIAAQLFQLREYSPLEALPQREFPDVGKPSFEILKQVAWRSTRIQVRELDS